MVQLFNRHKRLFIALAAAVGAVLAAIYIRALFLPGLWFDGIFLYKKADGSFMGSRAQNSCQMLCSATNDGAEISFTINDTTNLYRLVRGSTDSLQIYTNGELTFDGTMYQIGNGYMLFSSDGSDTDTVTVVVTTQYGTSTDEAPDFPSGSWLASAAFAEKLDTRGEPVYLIAIAIFALLLALDMAFPDLFYTLRHGLATDGGTPSTLYRYDQKISRVIIVIAIFAVAVMSFTMH